MLTGLTPYRHGAAIPKKTIRSDAPLLAEMLRERGYETVGLVSAPFVSAAYGFSRGFDLFVERFEQPRDPIAYHFEVLRTVRELERRPVFLFVHYFDVHAPYQPPPGYNRFAPADDPTSVLAPRGLRDPNLHALEILVAQGKTTLSEGERDLLVGLYDGGILGEDAVIGALLSAIDTELGPNTIVVLTADHGEEFLDHGGLLHGYTLYDEQIRVPLVVAGPGLPRGARVDTTVSLIDIVPTLLDYAGRAPDGATAGFDGTSLRPLLEGRGPGAWAAAERALPLHSVGGDNRVSLRGFRTPGEKLIRDEQKDRRLLFDLVADPKEQRALPELPNAASLDAALEKLSIPPSDRKKPRAAVVESLRALGYL
jgi:arylsulfatase A-like enzyme